MASSSSRLVALIVACAFILQQLDATIVTTSLPQMAISFGTSPVYLSTAVTSYLLGLALFVPVSSWVADRYGGRRVFCAAICIFTVGSILCGVSINVASLIGARLVQGLGGALMIPVGRLVLFRNVERAELVSVMAFLQMPSQLGPLLGPPIGGFITTYASWRWGFFVNIPFGILGISLALRYITRDGPAIRRPFDGKGFLFSSISVSGVMFGIELASHNAFEAMIGAALVAIGICFGTIAWFHIKRHPHPILDPSVFSVPTFNINFWGGSFFRAGSGTLGFLLPLLFQTVFGMTASVSGLLTVAVAVGSIGMRATAGPILRHFGFRTVLIVNTFLCTAYVLTCTSFASTTPFVVIFIVLMIGGLFPSLQFMSLQTLAYVDINTEQMSSATSIASMVQQLSRGIGIALVATSLHLTEFLRGATHLGKFDLDIAFIAGAAMIFSSLIFYLPMAHDTAADVTGQRR